MFEADVPSNNNAKPQSSGGRGGLGEEIIIVVEDRERKGMDLCYITAQ